MFTMALTIAAYERILTLAQAGQADELARLNLILVPLGCKLHAVRLAAANGRIACVRALLAREHGHRLRLERHALFTAAGHGEAECLRALCAAKAHVNAWARRPYPERTALTMAARHGCSDTIRALLEANAQPDGHDDWDIKPIDVAMSRGNDAAVLVLLEAGSRLPPLAAAAGTCSITTLQVLLQAKAAVNRVATVCLCTTPQGRRYEMTTPLRAAIKGGRADVVRVLCAAGADVDARYDDKTALELAQDCGHADVVRALCDAKADPGA
jgi:hypothetical protein